MLMDKGGHRLVRLVNAALFCVTFKANFIPLFMDKVCDCLFFEILLIFCGSIMLKDLGLFCLRM